MLFHEDEVDGDDEEYEGENVIPTNGRAVKRHKGEDSEDGKRDGLLHDLELDERERPSVSFEAHAVGGNLEGIFKQSYPPGQEDHEVKRPVG